MDRRKEWGINELPVFEKKDIYQSVFLNKYGYYELRRKNSRQERNKEFEEHYFQEEVSATYKKEYPPEEIRFIHAQIDEKAYVIEQNLAKTGVDVNGAYSVLDIGCGEGFLMQFFHDKGKRVRGIDVGSYALSMQHPDMMPFFEKGDMTELLPKMAQRGGNFDVINSDRVLDMVDDVDACLDVIKEVMHDQSILVIKTANNYSNLQRMLLERGEVKEEYWLDDPGHTGYFNREGMIARLQDNGFSCLDFYADTFVDFWLVNPFSNYYEKPETGGAGHKASVCLETLFHDVSLERTVDIYRMLGEMGFGREIVGVFAKK